ncbi:unnamed protein product [Callosobruchus maculatus]|uniref:Uncharacterized protein n=1 Tax=Callosobruchus maculatus TaxID=64391 RepID=A0A653BSF0_CALMS|nr:unnamed protein product [Callosobruchus maculatus]
MVYTIYFSDRSVVQLSVVCNSYVLLRQ